MIRDQLTKTERNLRTAMFALSALGVIIGIYMLVEFLAN
jgi:hypothetical protein